MVGIVADSALEPLYARLKLVREATGLTQLQFLPRLNAVAAKLHVREYSQSTLSKLETGTQEPSFDDVAVFAAVDPERRGKLWLAWNEREDSALQDAELARPQMPVERFERSETSRMAAAKKVAARRKRA